MSHTGLPQRRVAATVGLAVLALALTGCGRLDNHPTIVGEVAPDVLAAVPTAAIAAEAKPVASVFAAPGSPPAGSRAAGPAAAGRAAGSTAKATVRAERAPAPGVRPADATRPAAPGQVTSPRRSAVAEPAAVTPARARTAARAAAAPAGGLAMPAAGAQTYDLSGESSLGPLPEKMSVSVEEAPGAPDAQHWTFEGRTPDGRGVIEQLAVARERDGVHMSAYRLELKAGLVGVTFDFAPTEAVLLFPDRPKAGQLWEFDLVSTDGCATSHTEGVLVAAKATGTQTRHLRLTSTLAGTGRSGCISVDATRTQDIWQSGGNALPTRIDSDLAGSLGGVPVAARTSATLRQEPATRP